MAFNGEVLEIFSWLPVKSLFKFTSVARPCMDFLSEDYFMEKQCRNSWVKSDNLEGFFLEDDSCLRIKAENLTLCVLPENTSSSIGIPSKSLRFLMRKGRVLASSNGLLLCRTIDSKKPTKLFLCNPITKTWLPIKLPKHLAKKYQFSMDPNIVFICGNGLNNNQQKFPLDYSLMLFEPDFSEEWPMGVNVYILDPVTNKWVIKKENLQTGGRDLNFNNPVCCKDEIYFLSSCGDCISMDAPHYWPYVFCYNTHNEESSRKLALPEEGRHNFMSCNMNIFKWRKSQMQAEYYCFESICLVKAMGSVISVWVLKDTKDSRSWHRLAKLHIADDLGINDLVSRNMSFTITRKDLIFSTDGYIYRYCLEGEDQGRFQEICTNLRGLSYGVRFSLYSATLRPCKKDLIKPQLSIR